jgi:hypothetical protein
LSTNTEDEKEKRKISSYELLTEVARRLKEEILLLGLAIAFLVAQVAIFTREFSPWIAVTFIAVYLIAAVCYLVEKIRQIGSQLKKDSKEYIEWRVGYPKAFQNPNKIAEERSELSLVRFPVEFEVKNHMKKPLILTIYVKSPSQAVVFAWESPRKIWRRRLGIIPYREEVSLALDDWETRCIDPGQKERIVFRGIYRPHFAHDDFFRRGEIVLTYRIYGKDTSLGLSYVDSHEKKLYIKFADKVQYESEVNQQERS